MSKLQLEKKRISLVKKRRVKKVQRRKLELKKHYKQEVLG